MLYRVFPAFVLLVSVSCIAVPLPAAGAWSVVSSRWRSDADDHTKKQVWEGAFWSEGWREDEQYYPSHFTPSGSAHVILRNDAEQPDTISLTSIGDAPLFEISTTADRAGDVIWYRVRSPQLNGPQTDETGDFSTQRNVPPGQWVECVVRFRTPPRAGTRLEFVSKLGANVEVPLDLKTPAVRLESISFSPSIDRVYIYVRSMTGAFIKPGAVFMDGKDLSGGALWTNGPAGSGLTLVEAPLKPALVYGSYHLLELETGAGRLVQPVRAWDGYFAIGLYGEVTPERVKAAKEHGINAYFAQPSEALDQAGMCSVPVGPIDNARRRQPGTTGLLFYQNHDEPDAHDWARGKALPPMQRLGVMAQSEVLPLMRRQQQTDRTTLNLLLVDNTYKPAGWYVYGQIADVYCTDPYVPLNGRQADYVWRALEVARDACAPSPLVSVLWACSLRSANRKFGYTPPTPELERMMVFYALGCGVKGLAYFIDWSPEMGEAKFTGLSDIKPLWDEVGRTNKDVAALTPYLAVGCPVSKPEQQGAVWLRTLMCGRDRIVVVVVNTEHHIGFETRNEYVWHTAVKDADVTVSLPDGFRKCEVREVRGGQLVPAGSDKKGRLLHLHLDEVDAARAFVVSNISSGR